MLIHTVLPGETLYSIAMRYGVSVSRIRLDNGLGLWDSLAVGQALIITKVAEMLTVEPGDTLYSIAARSGVTVMELLQNNPFLGIDTPLQPGEMLTLSFQGEKRRTIRVGGYAYPFIDRALLRRTLPYLTYLWVFSYGFEPDGRLIVPEDRDLTGLARMYGVTPLMVLTTITGEGGFSSEKAGQLLASRALQDTVLTNLIAAMREKGYGGLDVDFEYIPAEYAGDYGAFLARAGERLREEGLLLTAALAPKTSASQPGLLYEAHDYPAMGAAANTAFLMTYEWGYAFGPPMAVSPMPQVRRVADYAVTEVAPEKLLLGVPNYGYDWQLPYMQGTRARTLGVDQAAALAADAGTEILFDETAHSPYYYYTQAGQQHVVWFEDVRSVEAKLDLADELGLGGVGYWNLMRPFSANWAYLAARYWIEKAEA